MHKQFRFVENVREELDDTRLDSARIRTPPASPVTAMTEGTGLCGQSQCRVSPRQPSTVKGRIGFRKPEGLTLLERGKVLHSSGNRLSWAAAGRRGPPGRTADLAATSRNTIVPKNREWLV